MQVRTIFLRGSQFVKLKDERFDGSILVSSGMSPADSLRKDACELREAAGRLLARAERYEQAASMLEAGVSDNEYPYPGAHLNAAEVWR